MTNSQPPDSLRARIAMRRQDVVLADERRMVSAAQVASSATPAHLSALAGRSVAIDIRDPLVKAQVLIWLDSLCPRLLLLPDDATSEDRAFFFKAASVSITLTDKEEPASMLGGDVVHTRSLRVERAPKRLGALAETKAQPPARVTTEWVLTTSGTTGRPKLVSHTLETLSRTTKTSPASTACWGLLYDIVRFAGLQVFLQALLGGGSLILPNPSKPLADQLSLLARRGCDSLSATPTMWRRIVMTRESEALRLKRITLGGEIADERILAVLSRVYPSAAIRHIYASTDAGVGFSVTDGRPGFPASFLKAPPPGIDVQVRDGRLFLRPHIRGQRYLSQDSLEGADGFIDTGDVVEYSGDRFLFVGRANGTINVGGNKVFPEEVEAVLLVHGRVALARVYAMKSPITGALVAADVVPKPGTDNPQQLKMDILAHCREQLPMFKVPATINLVSHLTLSCAGKIIRHA
jgi:acyl-coenzyme A synthetase/AMP-(fatty) acid ligase